MKIKMKGLDDKPEYDACGNVAVAAIEDEGVHLLLCQYCLEELVDSAIHLRTFSSDNCEFGSKFIPQERFDQLFDDVCNKGYEYASRYSRAKGAVLSGIQFTIDYMKEIYEEQRKADKSL